MIRDEIQARQAARAGALAGLCAGVFLTLLMTAMAIARSADVWYGIKGASAPFFGERAMAPGFDFWPVLIGLIAHLLISVGWGLLFGLLVDGLGRLATLAAGVAWGFVVWLGMYYVVLPIVGLSSMRADTSVGRAIAFHLLFSTALGVAYVVIRGVRLETVGRPKPAL